MKDRIARLGVGAGSAVLAVGTVAIAPAGAVAPPAPAGCTTAAIIVTQAVGVPIPDPGTVTDTITVAVPDASILDVDVVTNIRHGYPTDLDITVQSPAGTIVTLTTDNGSSADDAFDGTRWDDDAPEPATTYSGYAVGTPVATLGPEEPLAAFVGEDPNGTWTITVVDDFNFDAGTLDGWGLDITTIAGPLTTVAATAAIDPTVRPIPDLGTVQATVAVSGLPYLYDVDVVTDVTHPWPMDLDMVLTSPSGTDVTLSVDNGLGADDIFVAELWDDDADAGSQVPYAAALNPQIVTDHVYSNGVPAGPLTPQQGLGRLIGEDPNGIWTLTVTDDGAIGAGTLSGFEVRVIGATCVPLPPPPGSPAPPVPPVLPPVTGHDVDVVAGADRVATAIAVSRATFDGDGAGAVVLARRDGFPDALAGTPLAAAEGGPMLLSSTAALDADVEHEIERVLAAGGDVYLLGGEAALGPAVADRLAGLGYAVHRIAGEDRFDTAVAIAEALGSPPTVLEASGLDFPDAVSAGAAAIEVGAAVLLTDGASQSAATAGYLAANPGAARFAIGGPAAAADPSATGLVGFDRFATSALVAQRFFVTPTIAGVASGRVFPDALTGGVQVGVLGGPMLLTEPDDLPAPVTDFLDANFASIDRVIVYGGPVAVGPAVIDEATEAIT